MLQQKVFVDSEFSPRFSVALRAYCPPDKERSFIARDFASQIPVAKSKYVTLKDRYFELCPPTVLEKARALFKDLEDAAKEFVGVDVNAHGDLVEHASFILIKIFMKSHGRVSQNDELKLMQLFGTFNVNSAKKATECVHLLRELLSKETFKALVRTLGVDRSDIANGEIDNADDWFFGAELMDKFPKWQESDLVDFKQYAHVLEPELDYISSECEVQSAAEFTSVSQQSLDHRPVTGFTVTTVIEELSRKESVDIDFLLSSLFSLLESNRSDRDLENDLVELLGFEEVELILLILNNRQVLVDDYVQMTRQNIPRTDKAHVKRSSNTITGPMLGQQIVVQSERELELQKELRKETKRFSRLQDKHSRSNTYENVADSQDVDVLRKTELALQAAKKAPLFEHFEPGLAVVPDYPFVFDSLRGAQKSSAFIGGAKMVLPDGFKRIDSRLCEEVVIPPSAAIPTEVGNKRVKIAELDEFAQSAFHGTKELNRIQSVVFPAAYNSNENLLICAPTGAGKTNVAMCCILREIKQNLVHNVLKLDQFKIVYVAPMKALAAEMVRNFGSKLAHLGVQVRELTGDMQLTKQEILKTQMLITTPEKWDVVTRKSTGDVSLSQLVKLLIIDEIHLLHDDRGPVIETLVARTLRQAEYQQSMIRIVGLSATLPNYIDVARFLRVNPNSGLFFFDGRFRPVPLGQQFIGIKSLNSMQQMQDMDLVCYQKVLEFVKRGHQVMVFVHARNATGRIATIMKEMAQNKGDTGWFRPEDSAAYGHAEKMIQKSRNAQLKELFSCGFSIHHAGMLRQDRNIVERLFSEGHIRVLCCTATLAWGVNLPAHAVIIRGTEIYDAKRSSFVDLGVLDVQQIFGRAGRPQFDKEGHGLIITTHDKLAHYLSLLTRQMPIESQLMNGLADCLNAEICLGTVSNIDDAVEWLSYTYLFVRMRLNPLVYGISHAKRAEDPQLVEHRKDIIRNAALKLDQYQMIRFAEKEGFFYSTTLGRIASHFYIRCDTIEIFNEQLKAIMDDGTVFALVAQATEFQQLKVRDDEMDELDSLYHQNCVLPVPGGPEHTFGKVNILMQAYVSSSQLNSFSLISDSAYVMQNAQRILRALFEICLSYNWSVMTSRVLNLCKCMEARMWGNVTPLWQFVSELRPEVLNKIDERKLTVDKLREMSAKEIGSMLKHEAAGVSVRKAVDYLPLLDITPSVQPITRTVLRIRLDIRAQFTWVERIHGKAVQTFWIWVEDPDCELSTMSILHCECFVLHKRQVVNAEPQSLIFTIPVKEPLPSQYFIYCESDRFLGTTRQVPLSFQHLILPDRYAPHTELLNLHPLPVEVLRQAEFERLYTFTHFNAVQTQCFFTLYHTDSNVLLGSPTGSGKTIAAEIAIFRVFRMMPGAKCVYIAPLKALVRERMIDWKDRFEKRLGKRVVELTGDVTPDAQAIAHSDVIVTTPEKWDGISRSWQTRGYVKDVALIVIDEIHLLGEERGPVLEVIVSRTNFIAAETKRKVRVVGLSTALANARDLADWLGIEQMGLFNFNPAVRPVPLEIHIRGFPGKHYCPRMATMNKPAYQAIKTYAPDKPSLIFVASRRQTRLTALDLISFLAAESNPRMWNSLPDYENDTIIQTVRDQSLKLTLAFGIGMHHAGLQEGDRRLVEELFVKQKIQVLIATATLAWGVNFPARLVIIKGTEYYDGKTKRYVDFPITDVLQMMGRAGRPQFDDQGFACVFVHDVKKDFYKKFLYDPFPVESSLHKVLCDHLNAEIVAGTVSTKQEAMDYLTWTYFFRRLLDNPSYYGLEQTELSKLNQFLTATIDRTLGELGQSFCLCIGDDGRSIEPTVLGRIASYYYLSHGTVKLFRERLHAECTMEEVLKLLADAPEYDEIPVRHNEDVINGDLAKLCPIKVEEYSLDNAHTKTHLLYQAHFSHVQLPSTDYLTDLKSVLDQAIRILQAMLDVSAEQGFLPTSLRIIHMVQMVVQALWIHQPPVCALPHMDQHYLRHLRWNNIQIESAPELKLALQADSNYLVKALQGLLAPPEIADILRSLDAYPDLRVDLGIRGFWESTGEVAKHKPLVIKEHMNPHEGWMSVHADQEYVLTVDLQRLNKSFTGRPSDVKASRAIAPKFPKAKDEGWFLVLADVERRELLALRRIGFVKGRLSTQLQFNTPEEPCRVIYTLYVMSDAYLGLDQQYDVRLEVTEASLEAQMNAEVEMDG